MEGLEKDDTIRRSIVRSDCLPKGETWEVDDTIRRSIIGSDCSSEGKMLEI